MKKFLILVVLVHFSLSFGLNFQEVYHNYLGKRAYEKAKFAKSSEKFSQVVISKNKNGGIGNFNLGDSYYKQKDYDKAIAHYNVALLDRDFAHRSFAYQNIGNAYFRQGDLDKAKKSYIEAIKEDPSNYQARLNLEIAQKAQQEQRKEQGEEGSQDKQDRQKKENKEQDKQENKDGKSSEQDKQKQKQSQEQKNEKKQDKDDKNQELGKKDNEEDKKKDKAQKREAIKKKMADKKIDKILDKEKMLRLKKLKKEGEVPASGKYW